MCCITSVGWSVGRWVGDSHFSLPVCRFCSFNPSITTPIYIHLHLRLSPWRHVFSPCSSFVMWPTWQEQRANMICDRPLLCFYRHRHTNTHVFASVPMEAKQALELYGKRLPDTQTHTHLQRVQTSRIMERRKMLTDILLVLSVNHHMHSSPKTHTQLSVCGTNTLDNICLVCD